MPVVSSPKCSLKDGDITIEEDTHVVDAMVYCCKGLKFWITWAGNSNL